MPHRVLLAPAARRQADRLRGISLVALRGVILGLADDPRPPGSAKLTGRSDVWRVRLRVEGRSWRVVYRVDDSSRQVVGLRIVRRDEGTYRRL